MTGGRLKATMFTIQHYRLANGRLPFRDWLMRLADRQARVAVLRRIDRVAEGSFGEHRFLEAGVWEFKIDVGPAGDRSARSGKMSIAQRAIGRSIGRDHEGYGKESRSILERP